MLKVNYRNSRKTWNMLKFNNRDTRKMSFFKLSLRCFFYFTSYGSDKVVLHLLNFSTKNIIIRLFINGITVIKMWFLKDLQIVKREFLKRDSKVFWWFRFPYLLLTYLHRYDYWNLIFHQDTSQCASCMLC